MKDNSKELVKVDEKAPEFLEITVKDFQGNEWRKMIAREKVFSSGSVGFYLTDKIENPLSHE